MKAYVKLEIQLHPFLTSVTDGGDCFSPGRFNVGEQILLPIE